MAVSMASYINQYQAYYNSGIQQMSQIRDFRENQKQAQALLDSYNTNNARVQSLQKDSADFLKEYTSGMGRLDSAAAKLTNGGVNDLLYNDAGQVTEETVKNTVDAVKNMVDEYNKNLSMLNDNAQRGGGVERQIGRMSNDPAAATSMEMVGVSVNDDGTLALDEAKMTEALNTQSDRQRQLFADIIGGRSGSIAQGVRNDAQAGMNTPAGRLIENDLAEMRSVQQEDTFNNSIQDYARLMRGGGVYTMSNNAAVGIMMNMLV